MQVTIEGMKAGQITRSGHTQANTQLCHSTAAGHSQSSTTQQTTSHAVSSAVSNNTKPMLAQGPAGIRGVTIAVHIQLGVEQQNGDELIAALQSQPGIVISNGKLLAAIGRPDAASLYAAMVDVTPGRRQAQSEAAQPFAALTHAADAAPKLSHDLVPVRFCQMSRCIAKAS